MKNPEYFLVKRTYCENCGGRGTVANIPQTGEAVYCSECKGAEIFKDIIEPITEAEFEKCREQIDWSAETPMPNI
jgi:hypothetical protein